MATGFYRESAKIYEFPLKTRSRAGDRSRRTTDLATEEICEAALDSCWYHDEEIRKSDQKTKVEVARPHIVD